MVNPEPEPSEAVYTYVFDLETQRTRISMSAAAKALNANKSSIVKYLDKKASESCRPFKGKYIISIISS